MALLASGSIGIYTSKPISTIALKDMASMLFLRASNVSHNTVRFSKDMHGKARFSYIS